MNFLTIEKFNSRSKMSIPKKMTLIFVILIVPTIVFTAWVFYNVDDIALTQNTPVVSSRGNNIELTLVSERK